MFAEKLDLLMNTLDVSNIQLAKELHLDPSYISKLRNGRRKLPQNPDFLDEACCYFVKRAVRLHRENILITMIDKPWPEKEEQAASYLYHWLNDRFPKADPVSELLYWMNHSKVPDKLPEISDFESSSKDRVGYFYGKEGKREAVIQFFETILKESPGCTLKLFSEENMEWLFEDPAFLQTWKRMFGQCLKQGSKVIIIHNILRDLDELFNIIIQWLPIYMTGLIEPYYYPKMRDGVYHRTLFIAKDLAAIKSDVLAHSPDDMLNSFVQDKKAVQALEAEFDRYLEICERLMDIVYKDFGQNYRRLYKTLIKNQGKMYYRGKSPAIHTLPEHLANKWSAFYPGEPMAEIYEERRKDFIENLEHHEVHEIIGKVANLNEIHYDGNEMLARGEYPFTEEEIKEHYRELLRLLTEYENYHLYIDDRVESNLSILMSEGGIIVKKYNQPRTLFGIHEINMLSAFDQYFEDAFHFAHLSHREKVMAYLKEIIGE